MLIFGFYNFKRKSCNFQYIKCAYFSFRLMDKTKSIQFSIKKSTNILVSQTDILKK